MGKAVTEADRPGWWASELLKQALFECELGYRDLSERLRDHGVSMSPGTLNRRINRGKFTGDFLLLCLQVIGAASAQFDGMEGIELHYHSQNEQPGEDLLMGVLVNRNQRKSEA